MKNKLVLIGGGGHCGSCLDVIEQEGRFEIIAIADIHEKIGLKIFDHPITITDEVLEDYCTPDISILITIGQIKSALPRKQIFERLSKIGGVFPAIISPRAYVSKHAQIGKGSIVMHGAMVNAGAVVGDNCIINSTSLIEHDAIISDHCHIATGAVINGGTQVKQETFIGSSAVIREYITIGEKSIIGAGLTILQNLPAESFVKTDKVPL